MDFLICAVELYKFLVDLIENIEEFIFWQVFNIWGLIIYCGSFLFVFYQEINFFDDFLDCIGEYEYIDVISEGERVLIDIDFRSEFEIARSTSSYKSILQSLPFIFVGKSDRLQQIIAIVSEAARLSLKKKGMHIAPWRKSDYIKAKWLSPHIRTTTISPQPPPSPEETTDSPPEVEKKKADDAQEEIETGELELIFGETETLLDDDETPKSILSSPAKDSGVEEKVLTMVWQPPVIKPKSCERGNRVVVTGLASLLKEKP